MSVRRTSERRARVAGTPVPRLVGVIPGTQAASRPGEVVKDSKTLLDEIDAEMEAKFAAVGDFDGDGRDEVAIAPEATESRGNDFWVMDYDPGTQTWSHLGPTADGQG